jgi:hypothetical protein
MTASDITAMLVPTLEQHGFRAVRHSQSITNGYGHKISLFEENGRALGALVVYRGKQGARYVTNELTEATADIVDHIAKAWAALAIEKPIVTSAARSSIQLPPIPAGTVELWVDGACLQEADSLKQDARELMRHASHVIKSYMAVHRNVAAELQAVIHGLTQSHIDQGRSALIADDQIGSTGPLPGRSGSRCNRGKASPTRPRSSLYGFWLPRRSGQPTWRSVPWHPSLLAASERLWFDLAWAD